MIVFVTAFFYIAVYGPGFRVVPLVFGNRAILPLFVNKSSIHEGLRHVDPCLRLFFL